MTVAPAITTIQAKFSASLGERNPKNFTELIERKEDYLRSQRNKGAVKYKSADTAGHE